MYNKTVTMTKQQAILKELGKIYPQLQINAAKTTGAGAGRWLDDLLSETIEGFLKRPIDIQYKIAIEDKALENYLTRVMGISVKSKSSGFYLKYRKFTIGSREILDENTYGSVSYQLDECDTEVVRGEQNQLRVKQLVEDLPFYEKHLITEHYLNNRTIVDIAMDLNIQPARITSDIRKVLTQFKKNLQHGL